MQFIGPTPQPIGLHRALLAAIPNWRFNPTNLMASDSRVSGYVRSAAGRPNRSACQVCQ